MSKMVPQFATTVGLAILMSASHLGRPSSAAAQETVQPSSISRAPKLAQEAFAHFIDCLNSGNLIELGPLMHPDLPVESAKNRILRENRWLSECHGRTLPRRKADLYREDGVILSNQSSLILLYSKAGEGAARINVGALWTKDNGDWRLVSFGQRPYELLNPKRINVLQNP